jgi:hypothetical protein
MAISNCLFSPTSENSCIFYIRFVFANLVAEIHNEIKHKKSYDKLHFLESNNNFYEIETSI